MDLQVDYWLSTANKKEATKVGCWFYLSIIYTNITNIIINIYHYRYK